MSVDGADLLAWWLLVTVTRLSLLLLLLWLLPGCHACWSRPDRRPFRQTFKVALDQGLVIEILWWDAACSLLVADSWILNCPVGEWRRFRGGPGRVEPTIIYRWSVHPRVEAARCSSHYGRSLSVACWSVETAVLLVRWVHFRGRFWVEAIGLGLKLMVIARLKAFIHQIFTALLILLSLLLLWWPWDSVIRFHGRLSTDLQIEVFIDHSLFAKEASTMVTTLLMAIVQLFWVGDLKVFDWAEGLTLLAFVTLSADPFNEVWRFVHCFTVNN